MWPIFDSCPRGRETDEKCPQDGRLYPECTPLDQHRSALMWNWSPTSAAVSKTAGALAAKAIARPQWLACGWAFETAIAGGRASKLMLPEAGT